MEGCEISILLPVFNAGRFLEPLLDSVILQTWQNFELLIFDDGSTDHSWDVILQFSKRDRRIRPQRADVNRGQEFALKKISEECRGRLIMFCDQDDVWEPEKVRRLVDGIGECSMAYGTSPLIDADGKSLERTLFDAVGPPIEGKDCLELLFRNTASGHALLMKRTNLCQSAFVPSIANVLFDWRLAAAASYTGGLKFVPAAVTWHRIHGTNRNNSRVLANAKKIRRSHQQQLDRVSDLAGFLGLHPSIDPKKRAAFSRLFNKLQSYRALPKWHVNDDELRGGAARIAIDLGADEVAFGTFDRKLGRIARGWLHPAFWWGEMRARG